MSDEKYCAQAPIIRFFNRHKWRIIVPVLAFFLYSGLPRYLQESVAQQRSLFITSITLDRKQLNSAINETIDTVLSDEFLKTLVVKYDLFAGDREKGIDEELLIKKVRASIDLRPEADNLADGAPVFVWVHLPGRNFDLVAKISHDVVAKYQENQSLQVMQYVSPPYDPNPYKNWILIASVLQSLLMFSIPLILIWELPFLFYSDKTREAVFEPLKADWQSELTEAKLHSQSWRAVQINFHYSKVFLNALWQMSPLGDSIELLKRIGR